MGDPERVPQTPPCHADRAALASGVAHVLIDRVAFVRRRLARVLGWLAFAAAVLPMGALIAVQKLGGGGFFQAVLDWGVAPALPLALLSVLLGFVNVIDNPARQTFVLEMVGRDELQNAVALNSVVMNSSRVIGPAIGGVVISLIGLAPCFYLNAASYLAVLLALAMMDATKLQKVPTVPRAKGQLRDGFRYVWSDRMVRTPLLMMAVIGTLVGIKLMISGFSRLMLGTSFRSFEKRFVQ